MSVFSKVLVDIIDDLKCVTFTSKAWNYIGLALVILAGWYWGSLSDHGDFFKVTGLIMYGVAVYKWISKSDWGKFMLDSLK